MRVEFKVVRFVGDGHNVFAVSTDGNVAGLVHLGAYQGDAFDYSFENILIKQAKKIKGEIRFYLGDDGAIIQAGSRKFIGCITDKAPNIIKMFRNAQAQKNEPDCDVLFDYTYKKYIKINQKFRCTYHIKKSKNNPNLFYMTGHTDFLMAIMPKHGCYIDKAPDQFKTIARALKERVRYECEI